jgi:hypothetical protein
VSRYSKSATIWCCCPLISALSATIGLPLAMFVLNELLNERLKLDLICLAGRSTTRPMGGILFRCSSCFIFEMPSSAISSSCSCAFVEQEPFSSWIVIAFLASGGFGIGTVDLAASGFNGLGKYFRFLIVTIFNFDFCCWISEEVDCCNGLGLLWFAEKKLFG